jgi:hypothetical protein
MSSPDFSCFKFDPTSLDRAAYRSGKPRFLQVASQYQETTEERLPGPASIALRAGPKPPFAGRRMVSAESLVLPQA